MFEEESRDSDFIKHHVTSLQEYLNVVKRIKAKEELTWFRGQSKAQHSLIPSAMRQIFALTDWRGEPIYPYDVKGRGESIAILPFQGMLEKFKEIARSCLGGLLRVEPKNNLEWYFLAQHYGVPTTLLDWSTDPLIALFFATQANVDPKLILPMNKAIEDFNEDSFSKYGAAVFVINPKKINGIVGEHINSKTNDPIIEILNIADEPLYDHFKHYLDYDLETRFQLPFCVLGGQIDRRICRQSGNFTIHGSQIKPLDYSSDVQKVIHKIFIPYEAFDNIKEWLKVLDITQDSVYGDGKLQSLVSSIGQEATDNFEMLMNQMISEFQQTHSPN